MRPDLNVIAGLVPDGARVLDLGCGDGALLDELIRVRGCSGQGVEVSQDAFFACLGRGIPVVSADIDQGLPDFADGSFDVVVLSQTLQAVHRPALVIREMMRVARTGIVSFSNYGHVALRVRLLTRGRMPVSRMFPDPWFETPTIHPCTLRDFDEFLAGQGVRSQGRVLLNSRGVRADGLRSRAPNLLSAGAVYVIRADEGG